MLFQTLNWNSAMQFSSSSSPSQLLNFTEQSKMKRGKTERESNLTEALLKQNPQQSHNYTQFANYLSHEPLKKTSFCARVLGGSWATKKN